MFLRALARALLLRGALAFPIFRILRATNELAFLTMDCCEGLM